MRLPYLSLFILLFSISSSTAITNITAIDDNGNWNSSSTWSLNRIPSDGDHVIIPEFITVEITSNLYNAVPTRPTLSIELRGTLRLIGGSGQLNLSCSSNICTYGTGSIPSSGCNCNQISMGVGQAEWKGTDATVASGSCVTGGCFLPVTLTGFEVLAEANEAQLSWTLENAVDFSRIEIEKSEDGISFVKTESIPYEGRLTYLWEEEIQHATYYRLKLIDLDNSAVYSATKLATPSSSPVIFPNPSNAGTLNIAFNSFLSDTLVSILLLDALGNQVGSYELAGPSASLSTAEFAPGIYQLIIRSAEFQYTESVVLN